MLIITSKNRSRPFRVCWLTKLCRLHYDCDEDDRYQYALEIEQSEQSKRKVRGLNTSRVSRSSVGTSSTSFNGIGNRHSIQVLSLIKRGVSDILTRLLRI